MFEYRRGWCVRVPVQSGDSFTFIYTIHVQENCIFCICTYMCTHMHMQKQKSSKHTRAHTYIYIFKYVYIYIKIYIYIHTCTDVSMCVAGGAKLLLVYLVYVWDVWYIRYVNVKCHIRMVCAGNRQRGSSHRKDLWQSTDQNRTWDRRLKWWDCGLPSKLNMAKEIYSWWMFPAGNLHRGLPLAMIGYQRVCGGSCFFTLIPVEAGTALA